jgi:hypothetical protein
VAVQAKKDRTSIHKRAEALLDQVSSESPVVNWGLTELHALTRDSDVAVDRLDQRRTAWLTELRRYERDPGLWMRRHFQTVIEDFAKTHGPDESGAFASKLVRDGLLAQGDLPSEPAK